jgi:hypothetical protein
MILFAITCSAASACNVSSRSSSGDDKKQCTRTMASMHAMASASCDPGQACSTASRASRDKPAVVTRSMVEAIKPGWESESSRRKSVVFKDSGRATFERWLGLFEA